MIKILGVSLFCVLFLTGCFFMFWTGDTTVRVIITFDWEDDLAQVVQTLPAIEGLKFIGNLDLINGIVAEIPKSLIPVIEKQFRVRYIEEDATVYALDVPPPALIQFNYAEEIADETTRQWNMTCIDAYEAHKINMAQEVRVGVIDTGISSTHRDLEGAVKGGYNAIGIPGWGSWEDDNGHGTAVAGIIGSRIDSYGIIGVAPKCWLYAIKVLDAQGRGLSSNVVKGYQWALDQEISLVNLSLGSWFKSQAMADAMWIAGYQGMGTIAASGNDGKNRVLYPAHNHPAIPVGAVGTDLKRKSWSNYGARMKITGVVAPGDYVLTLNHKGGHRRVSGTSIATPHVTGIVALMVGMRYPLRRFMFQSASRAGDPDVYTGYGLVNVKGTLDELIAASREKK